MSSTLSEEQKKVWNTLKDPFLNRLDKEPMLAGSMYMNNENGNIYVCDGKKWMQVVGTPGTIKSS